MEKWFKEITLETAHIKLQPIRLEHKNQLLEASKDGNLSELWFTPIPNTTTIDAYITRAIDEFKKDQGLAFVVIDKKTNKIIGTTRYMSAAFEHKRLEIGFTWYAKSYQKTYVNSECKLLLLTYAFEILKTVVVEFRTNWHNQRSRDAIARLGAKQDGVLRNHQTMPNGLVRDTVVFSIIENEWAICKCALIYKIGEIYKKNNPTEWTRNLEKLNESLANIQI